MTHGWRELFRTKLFKKSEFVSADARRLSNDPRTYEMLGGTTHQLNITTPDRAMTNPTPRDFELTDAKQNPYGVARAYVTPVASYSQPRPPVVHKDWDPSATHARPMEPMTTKEFDLKIASYPD